MTIIGDALTAASVALNANFGKAFTGTLAIALGLAAGMAIIRLVKRQDAEGSLNTRATTATAIPRSLVGGDRHWLGQGPVDFGICRGRIEQEGQGQCDQDRQLVALGLTNVAGEDDLRSASQVSARWQVRPATRK